MEISTKIYDLLVAYLCTFMIWLRAFLNQIRGIFAKLSKWLDYPCIHVRHYQVLQKNIVIINLFLKISNNAEWEKRGSAQQQ